MNLAAVLQKKQLRLALRRAGYPAAQAAHLIHDSQLLADTLATATGSGDATNTRADLGTGQGRASNRWMLDESGSCA